MRKKLKLPDSTNETAYASPNAKVEAVTDWLKYRATKIKFLSDGKVLVALKSRLEEEEEQSIIMEPIQMFTVMPLRRVVQIEKLCLKYKSEAAPTKPMTLMPQIASSVEGFFNEKQYRFGFELLENTLGAHRFPSK